MKYLSMLGVAILLAGCASGSCSDQKLLQPRTVASDKFSVTAEPEYDSLFMEGQKVALWLYPCIADRSRELLPGTLCGTVIVSPGTSFRFVDATVHVLAVGQREPLSLNVKPSNFEIGMMSVGSTVTGVSSLLASRPYKLPGSRLKFALIQEPYATPIRLVLPPIEVNSARMEFPTISITPAIGRRCYHGAW